MVSSGYEHIPQLMQPCQRGGCDAAEMRQILNHWFEEGQGQGLDSSNAVAQLVAVFKHRNVGLNTLVKKIKQSQGVRRSLGELHYEKLRQAAKSGEFTKSDCRNFAYQISTRVAATVNTEIRRRQEYGPQIVDVMLEAWFECPDDEVSFQKMVNILKDPYVGKAPLAQSFMERGLPPWNVEERNDISFVGNTQGAATHVTRRDSILVQARTFGKKQIRLVTDTVIFVSRLNSLITYLSQYFDFKQFTFYS